MKLLYGAFLSLLLLTTSCYSKDKSGQEAIAFCAEIHKDDLKIIFPDISIKEKIAYVLMTQYKFDPEMSPDGSRATVGGHAYIQGSDLITLQSMTVLTINNNILMDAVVFFIKNERALEGFYYTQVKNDGKNPFSSLVYIDPVGNVIHLNVSTYGDNDCLSMFPKSLIDKLIIDK
ncbi:hypothetical protein [Trabulsiella odontotermitis]|uniref:hypothetical protein n=1 Tax=Trabulsiella odontotermitis TaxID=379893 RepID=UPI000675CEEE|nr:hypothetical protein [Trabulsiella odontotermitis]KNC93006.1 hypothetical protein GM30_14575 [Trabulsiella odontotermitis]